MSIEIPITPKELRSIGRELAKPQDFVCLDNASYIKVLLVARERLSRGQDVKATIIKPKVSAVGTSPR